MNSQANASLLFAVGSSSFFSFGYTAVLLPRLMFTIGCPPVVLSGCPSPHGQANGNGPLKITSSNLRVLLCRARPM